MRTDQPSNLGLTELAPQLETERGPAEFCLARPVAEFLLSPDQENIFLPPDIADNPELRAEAAERRALLGSFEELFGRLSEVTTQASEALDRGLVSEAELCQLYQNMIEFLQRDPENIRLLLYFPFEFLPNKINDEGKTEILRAAETEFLHTYREGWYALLETSEVRANYLDGNIIETSLSRGKPPRVIKATHLVPELLRRGILTVSEVTTLLFENEGEVLATNLSEALVVSADLKLIPRPEWRTLLTDADPKRRQLAFLTAHSLLPGQPLDETERVSLFYQFLPEAYDGKSAYQMYQAIEESLPALAALVHQGILAGHDLDEARGILCAAARFWSFVGTSSQALAALAADGPDAHFESLFDAESFLSASRSKATERWVRLWNEKFLLESGEASEDGLASSEVMSITESWQRVHRALVAPRSGDQDTTRYSPEQASLELAAGISGIEAQYSDFDESASPIAKNRYAWEKDNKKAHLRARLADQLASEFLSGEVELDDLIHFTQTSNQEQTLTGVTGLSQSLERLADQDQKRAQELFQRLEPVLRSLYENSSISIQDQIITLWSHLAVSKVISADYLGQRGLIFPDLGAASPGDSGESVKKTTSEIKPAVEAIEADPELYPFVYPACLLFGSRLKGYAGRNADLDAAVFIRPEAKLVERDLIEARINQVFTDNVSLGKVVTIWLEQAGESLQVRDLSQENNAAFDPDWVHVIFGGAWYGDQETIKNIQSGLLPRFLSESKVDEAVWINERRSWLRKMERDVLQYRLMHKGYARFYPRRGGIRSEHSDLIDGQSSFCDSGFRRVATRLFLRKVFLPDLRKKA